MAAKVWIGTKEDDEELSSLFQSILLSKFPGEDHEDDRKALGKLSSGSEGYWSCMSEALTSLIDYQGFDPAHILKVLTMNKNKFKPEQDTTLTYDVKGKSGGMISFTHNLTVSDVKTGIDFLLMLICYRGVALKKIMDRSAEELSKFLKVLIGKYGIDAASRAPGTAIGRNCITLGRIKNIFPITVLKFANSGNYKFVVTSVDVGFDGAQNTPLCMYCDSLTSILVKKWCKVDKSGGLRQWCFMLALLHEEVYRRSHAPTPLNKMITYFEAAYNSSVTTEAARIVASKGFQIATDVGYNPSLVGMRSQCEDKIRSMRTNDPFLNDLLDILKTKG